MKTHIALIVAVLTALVTTQAADTPAAIAADYRAKAETALAKVNATLEAATVPIIANLVKAGDTVGADDVKTQLKAKQDGTAVPKPHPNAANLFTLYDAARLRALDPIQKTAISRIENLLKSADGKKLEIVEALGRVRHQIESGRVKDHGIPVEWTYHRTKDSPAESDVFLNADGSFVLDDGKEKRLGKWKPGKEPGTLTIRYAVNDSTWKVSIEDDVATVERPDIKETRFFRVKKAAAQ